MRKSAVILRFPAHRVRRAPSRAVFAPLSELEAQSHAMTWLVSACAGALAFAFALALTL